MRRRATYAYVFGATGPYEKLSRASSRHLRVALHRESDGALTATNLLGAPIKQLWIADSKGAVYEANGITEGQKAVLTAQGKAAGSLHQLRAVYAQNWLALGDRLTRDAKRYLVHGSYLATLDSTPFLEEGMAGARPRTSESIIFGILKEGGDAR